MSRKKINKKIFILILLLFVLSVVVRLPHINKPLCGEWLPATVLRHMDIWNSSSIINYTFNPVMTYTNPGDRFINNQGKQTGPDGICYYTSYPQFSYIAPYGVFQFLRLDINPVNLRFFNIFFHLICCLLLFFILYEVFEDEIIAVAGMSVYLFSKLALFCHNELYMADMFVPWLYCAGIFLVIRIASRRHALMEKCLLPVVTFLMIYTEWLGVFFAFSVFLYGLFVRKSSHGKYLILCMCFSGLAAISWITIQFSLISGFGEFINACRTTYAFRSGISSSDNISLFGLKGYIRLLAGYWRTCGLTILTLICGFILILDDYRKKDKVKEILAALKENHCVLLIYLVVTPIILHYLVFFNFNAIHIHGIVKTLLVFSVAMSLLCYLVKNNPSRKAITLMLSVIIMIFLVLSFFPRLRFRFQAAQVAPEFTIASLAVVLLAITAFIYLTLQKRCRYKTFVAILLLLLCGVNIIEYRAIFDRQDSLKYDMGTAIRKNANTDEIVILDVAGEPDFEILPDMIFYAKRNVILYVNLNDSAEIIKKNGAKKGRVMTFEKGRLKKCALVSLNSK